LGAKIWQFATRVKKKERQIKPLKHREEDFFDFSGVETRIGFFGTRDKIIGGDLKYLCNIVKI
jgi:hypothetical protein